MIDGAGQNRGDHQVACRPAAGVRLGERSRNTNRRRSQCGLYSWISRPAPREARRDRSPRRLAARRGHRIAVVALARRLSRILYVLTNHDCGSGARGLSVVTLGETPCDLLQRQGTLCVEDRRRSSVR